MPKILKLIGDYAFNQCTNLSSINIPPSVTSIGKYAFYSCKGFKIARIPSSVTSIGEGAFGECKEIAYFQVDPNNSNYQSVDGILFSKNLNTLTCFPPNHNLCSYKIPETVKFIEPCSFCCTKLRSIIFSNSITTIPKFAFYKAHKFVTFIIPTQVVSIGESAFEQCNNLSSIFLPQNVQSFELSVFFGCKQLESIKVDENNPYFESYQNVLYTKSTVELLLHPRMKMSLSFPVPLTVTSLREHSFMDCS